MKLRLLAVLSCLFVASTAAAGRKTTATAGNLAVIDRVLAASDPKARTIRIGDMDFPRAALVAHRDKLAGKKSAGPDAAFDGKVTLWTGGLVPYAFDEKVTAEHRRAFRDAAADWATFAALTFVERTTQPNYILVVDSPNEGGYSAVGMIGGAQELGIGANSWNRGTLCHELGHALGLIHEHQRSDREDYVESFPENVIPGLEANFITLPNTINGSSYDFLSCMHYSRYSFSIDPGNLETLRPLPAYAQFTNVMGEYFLRVLSRSDRDAMAAAYGAGPALTPLVTTTADSGPGSLRAAITYAFDHPGTTITFNIPQADPGYDAMLNVWIIRPTDALPRIPPNTTINAETQPGTHALPRVVLNGANAGPGTFASGLVFTESGATVRGFHIINFFYDGVLMYGDGLSIANHNTVKACIIGLDSAGNPAPNGFGGVNLLAGDNNLIGGTTAADRCVISGNSSRGVGIFGTSSNTVSGCFIGTDRTGALARPNGLEGVFIAAGSSANYIGTASPGGGNVISGNSRAGVVIAGLNAEGNFLLGNAIGTNAARDAALPNQNEGVAIFDSARQNFVGFPGSGGYPTSGNLISGNLGPGLTISGAGTGFCTVAANRIGTNGAGTAALPNGGAGVAIFGTTGICVVGGQLVNAGNLISGNADHGVAISDGARANLEANVIGLNAAGTAALGNGGSGVSIFGGANSELGSDAPGTPANVLAGNALDGVTVSGSATAKLVRCLIGTDALGNGTIGNGFAGVAVFGGAFARLGPEAGGPVGGNLIAGPASKSGVVASGTGTSAEIVSNNFRGHGSAIVLFGGSSANVAFNGFRQFAFSGIEVFDAGTTGTFQTNLFDAGSRVPINLVGGAEDGQGRTANDAAGDADTGPNGLLNYPVLNSALQQANGTRVQGTYAGPALTSLTLDFYNVGPAGEIASAIGSTVINTNGAGTAAFDVVLPGLVRAGRRVVATATAGGATSEFSLGPVVTVVDADGDGLPDDYELANGLSPLDPADALRDADGDGQSNLAEYLAGTNPGLAASRLRIELASNLSNSYALTIELGAGRAYAVEYNDDLAAGTWRPLVPILVGGTTLTVPTPRNGGSPGFTFPPPPPRYFYRARLLP